VGGAEPVRPATTHPDANAQIVTAITGALHSRDTGIGRTSIAAHCMSQVGTALVADRAPIKHNPVSRPCAMRIRDQNPYA
jgi:hypothetical protein